MSKFPWHEFNHAVKITNTAKLFYSKYAYRMRVYGTGMYLIRAFRDEYLDYGKWAEFVELRRTKANNKNSVWASKRSALDNCNADQLFQIREIINRKDIGHRIEGLHIDLYADTEEKLYDIADKSPYDIGAYVSEVQRPANAAALQLLVSGNIVTKKQHAYKYRVSIHEGQYPAAVKTQLLDYISGLGLEEARLTPGLIIRLQAGNLYIHSTYFYVNNPEVLTFVKLISPKFINKIYKLEPTPE